MNKKITWSDIYKEFRKNYPSLATTSMYYKPFDYLKIEVWQEDGAIIIYDYFTNKCDRLDRTWKERNNDGKNNS